MPLSDHAGTFIENTIYLPSLLSGMRESFWSFSFICAFGQHTTSIKSHSVVAITVELRSQQDGRSLFAVAVRLDTLTLRY